MLWKQILPEEAYVITKNKHDTLVPSFCQGHKKYI